jgi:hypothetical protein
MIGSGMENDQDDFLELDAQLQLNMLERRLLVSSQKMLRVKFYMFLLAAVVVASAIAGYIFWQLRFGDGFTSHLDILGGSLGILGAFVVVELILGAFSALQAKWKATLLLHAQDYAISQAEECLRDAG